MKKLILGAVLLTSMVVCCASESTRNLWDDIFGNSDLHILAEQKNKVAEFEKLLGSCVDLTAENQMGFTAADYAAQACNVAALELLKLRGVDLNNQRAPFQVIDSKMIGDIHAPYHGTPLEKLARTRACSSFWDEFARYRFLAKATITNGKKPMIRPGVESISFDSAMRYTQYLYENILSCDMDYPTWASKQ